MSKSLNTRMQQKVDTAERWKTAGDKGFTPLQGEIIVYQDGKSSKIKIGDGATVVGELPFIAGEGGGSGDGENITFINVAALPTENINENIAYRVLEGTFVAQKRFRYDATCHVVDWVNGPTGTGENALRIDGSDLSYVGYYNIVDNQAYAYIDKKALLSDINNSTLDSTTKAQLIAAVYLIANGWQTFEDFIDSISSIVSTSWGGIAYTLEDIINESAVYLFVGAKTFCRNNGVWTSGDYTIGRRGTDSDAEVFNDLNNVASAPYAHAEGSLTTAGGAYSHAEGYMVEATGLGSHAEGQSTHATGANAHAEGNGTTSSGTASHTEGVNTIATTWGAHAEGGATQATHEYTHAEGYNTKATVQYAHAEGNGTTASGVAAHSEGNSTRATGQNSHAEGYNTEASYYYSHAEGANSISSGEASHAEGLGAQASGAYSHAEGQGSQAQASRSHAEGHNTVAKADASHAGGRETIAAGVAQTAIGRYNEENTKDLFIVGRGTSKTDRKNAFTVNEDGFATVHTVDSTNTKSVVNIEFLNSELSNLSTVGKSVESNGEIFNDYAANKAGSYAHAEGRGTKAYGPESHTEGLRAETTTAAQYAHAEGYETKAQNVAAHAEGMSTVASGYGSHAGGIWTVADGYAQTAIGRYNKTGTNSLFAVGDGTAANDRVDAFAVNKDGTVTTGREDYVLTKSVDTSAKAAEFSSLFANAIGDVSSFLFFTDPHFFYPGNSKRNMDTTIKYLQRYYEETPTSFVLNGGDMLQGGDTKAQACQKLGYVDKKLRTSFDRYYYVFGNHDNNYQGAAYPGNQDANHVDKLSTEQVRNLCMRDQKKTYYSFLDSTTRYYVFDTGIDWDAASMSDFRWEQVDWFANELISKDDDHNAMIAHQMFYTGMTPNALADKLLQIARAYNEKTSITLNDKPYNFSNTKGIVHYYLAGHSHEDRVEPAQNRKPCVVLTRNAYASSWSEPTFDLVLADYAADKLHLVRVGAGESRTVDIALQEA